MTQTKFGGRSERTKLAAGAPIGTFSARTVTDVTRLEEDGTFLEEATTLQPDNMEYQATELPLQDDDEQRMGYESPQFPWDDADDGEMKHELWYAATEPADADDDAVKHELWYAKTEPADDDGDEQTEPVAPAKKARRA